MDCMQKIAETLARGRIFRGYDVETIIKKILPYGNTTINPPGDIIMTCGSAECDGCIGILIEGRAVIYSADEGRRTLLRFVSVGEEVGVASLFASSPLKTQIVACGDSPAKTFTLSRDAVIELMKDDADGMIRTSLLSLLSDKAAFLNKRIACLSGGSAERRLAIYLRSLLPPADSGVDCQCDIQIGMSMKALAAALDIGRASLYRAFDSLDSSNIIKRDGNTVVILSRTKLDSICG